MGHDGVINVFKPPGVTSHDVVSKIRKILNTKKVGHTGTLDPDAVGVLPICIGKATRLVEYLTLDSKTYRAFLAFGSETDTQDSSGEVILQEPLPTMNWNQFEETLERFKGDIKQIPPMYSAIKVNGQPLYKLARQGKEVEREPRSVYIKEINLLEYDKKTAFLEIDCGKGTYIRTLSQDIGRAVKSAAHMSFLIRTRSGCFEINKAFTLEEIAMLSVTEFLISPTEAIDFPEIYVNANIKKIVLNGNKLSLELFKQELKLNEKYKILDPDGKLIAIASVKGDYLQPEKVLG